MKDFNKINSNMDFIDTLIDSYFKDSSSYSDDNYLLLINNIINHIEKSFNKEEARVIIAHVIVDLTNITTIHFKLDKNILINLLKKERNLDYNILLRYCLF